MYQPTVAAHLDARCHMVLLPRPPFVENVPIFPPSLGYKRLFGHGCHRGKASLISFGRGVVVASIAIEFSCPKPDSVTLRSPLSRCSRGCDQGDDGAPSRSKSRRVRDPPRLVATDRRKRVRMWPRSKLQITVVAPASGAPRFGILLGPCARDHIQSDGH